MAIREFKETFDFEWAPEMIEVTQVPVTENVADISHLQIDLNIRHAYDNGLINTISVNGNTYMGINGNITLIEKVNWEFPLCLNELQT